MGRFLNADGYAATGQGLLGNNMFAYCSNNSVSFIDPSGCMRVAYEGDLYGGYGGAYGGLALAFPFVWLADVLTGTITFNKEQEKTKDKSQVIADARTRDTKHQEFFPANPYEFAPAGLVMHVCVKIGAGPEGGIIKWELPGTKIAIFEWDEDYTYGPHYHVMMPEWKNKHLDPEHYKAGEPVPEPWNTMYFGR